MSFAEASGTIVTFGEYEGLTIDQIAQSDRGLLWLDRIAEKIRTPRLAEAIRTYLHDPSIARDLDSLTHRR